MIRTLSAWTRDGHASHRRGYRQGRSGSLPDRRWNLGPAHSASAIANLDASGRVFQHLDDAACWRVMTLPLQLKVAIRVPHHPVIRDGARLLQPKHLIQRQPARERSVEVVASGRRLRKALVVLRPVLRLEKRIRARDIRDAFAAQLFDEPILVGPRWRSMRPFAWGELAGMMVIPSVAHIRPNCVNGAAPVARSS